MRLRQLALVAKDLEPVVDDLCAVLGVEVAFRDEGIASFGLHNALLALGDSFLEVVSPIEPGTTAERQLDRRGGDGGYMVIVQVDGQDLDLEMERKRLADCEVRIVWEARLSDIATLHLHPRDVGAVAETDTEYTADTEEGEYADDEELDEEYEDEDEDEEEVDAELGDFFNQFGE